MSTSHKIWLNTVSSRTTKCEQVKENYQSELRVQCLSTSQEEAEGSWQAWRQDSKTGNRTPWNTVKQFENNWNGEEFDTFSTKLWLCGAKIRSKGAGIVLAPWTVKITKLFSGESLTPRVAFWGWNPSGKERVDERRKRMNERAEEPHLRKQKAVKEFFVRMPQEEDLEHRSRKSRPDS